MADEIIKKYGERVGYTVAEMEKFYEGGHRIRHLKRLVESAPLYTIEAEVVRSQTATPVMLKARKYSLMLTGTC